MGFQFDTLLREVKIDSEVKVEAKSKKIEYVTCWKCPKCRIIMEMTDNFCN